MKRSSKKAERARRDKEWQRAVKERDGHACQKCGYNVYPRGLHAHHIFSKGAHPHMRFDVEDGITLCLRHHLYWAHTDGCEFTEWLKTWMGEERYTVLLQRAKR